MEQKSNILGMKKNRFYSIPHPGFFVRKSFYEKVKYNTKFKYAADREFFFKIKYPERIKKVGYVTTKMKSGGLGSSKACRRESNQIYLANKIYFHVLKTNVKAFVKRILTK